MKWANAGADTKVNDRSGGAAMAPGASALGQNIPAGRGLMLGRHFLLLGCAYFGTALFDLLLGHLAGFQ